ncbi:MAG: hypothetical protein M1575_02640 [Patescibacteria group bacterium]|nr:hypothetical protein [Patescibacteria group bacterium]MCL5095601.1 hypothetical protein [Patescibacteria group bacterium]
MTDTAQLLLITVVIVLTILLTVIGIQVVYILKEFRRSMEKINKILDDAGLASGAVAKSIAGLSGLTAGFKTAFSLLSFFKKKETPNEQQ